MEKSLLSRILAKFSIAIIAIALLDLVYLNYLVIGGKNIGGESRPVSSPGVSTEDLSSSSPEPEASPQTPQQEGAGQAKTVVEKQTATIVQTAQKEIFIPMGAGSTKSRDFADLTSTDVTIDTSKYSNIESVVFEASVWVEGGNGASYAQLYNVSDKTGYFESQLTNNTGTAVAKTSGNLPLPNGQKTYRVRAKTDIVEFAANVSNARLKITLK